MVLQMIVIVSCCHYSIVCFHNTLYLVARLIQKWFPVVIILKNFKDFLFLKKSGKLKCRMNWKANFWQLEQLFWLINLKLIKDFDKKPFDNFPGWIIVPFLSTTHPSYYHQKERVEAQIMKHNLIFNIQMFII